LSPYLTKSDFKACVDCRTKLFYRKNRYPSAKDEDPYLKLLADGGFMVEFIAKAQFPQGVDLSDERNAAFAFARTRELLASDGAVVFEAAALHDRFYVRTDILVRKGNQLDLIEVKSSGLDAGAEDEPFRNTKGGIAARWREYLEDLAFQTMVLRAAFPDFRIRPWLCVVNKSHRAKPGETLDLFTLQRPAGQARARPALNYAGDASLLVGTGLLARRDASAEVDDLMPEVVEKAGELAELLGPAGPRRVQEDVSTHYRVCRTCEYRTGEETALNGFRECWGNLAKARPHILQLHRVGQVQRKDEPDPVSALLRRGLATVTDLEEQDLEAEGTYARRRLLQWRHSQGEGTEHLPDELKRALVAHQTAPGYPLHFVDFEACNLALPPHAGLRPYERVAFQWSCHSLHQNGELTHREWLNTERQIPNFDFARSLRNAIGDHGTVYVWSPYEQSTLSGVQEEMLDALSDSGVMAARESGLASTEELRDLADWIGRLLGPADAKGKRQSPRIRDLHELALKHYFHPMMGGRTSIKVVLPAVWTINPGLRRHPWFRSYAQGESGGQLLDPYKTLQPLPLGDDHEEDVVEEGTGAIRVYQDLIFRSDHSEDVRQQRRKLLLQYCRLDTAAMVMIWSHWTGLISPKTPS
jgi:hypothetical protein